MPTQKPDLVTVISDLAYKQTSLSSKLKLLYLGGIVTFLTNFFKGNLHEAFFGPCSHCYSVASTAGANLKNPKLGSNEKLGWMILCAAGGISAIFFERARLLFGVKPVNELHWELMAAHQLKLWGNAQEAVQIAKRGLEYFPNSLYLKRRCVMCYLEWNDSYSGFLRESLVELERGMGQLRIKQPEEFVRTAVVLISGWRKLDFQYNAQGWYNKALPIAREHCPDQVVKLDAVMDD